MISRIAASVAGFFAAVGLVTLAVINRHGVQMVLDPFNPQRPVIAIELPFYAYLFAMLIVGVILGGLATWLSQGKWRRQLRARTLEALRWKGEAERLQREHIAGMANTGRGEKKQLALTGR